MAIAKGDYKATYNWGHHPVPLMVPATELQFWRLEGLAFHGSHVSTNILASWAKKNHAHPQIGW